MLLFRGKGPGPIRARCVSSRYPIISARQHYIFPGLRQKRYRAAKGSNDLRCTKHVLSAGIARLTSSNFPLHFPEENGKIIPETS